VVDADLLWVVLDRAPPNPGAKKKMKFRFFLKKKKITMLYVLFELVFERLVDAVAKVEDRVFTAFEDDGRLVVGQLSARFGIDAYEV